MMRHTARRFMTFLGVIATFGAAQLWSAQAQVEKYDCPAIRVDVPAGFVRLPANCGIANPNCVPIPEIVSEGGVLRGTIKLQDALESLQDTDLPDRKCVNQLLRFYVRGDQTVGGEAIPPAPMPGPTLRARLGDVVALTFLNQIDPRDYFGSIDRAENGVGAGCDTGTGAPGYPNLGTNKSNTIGEPVIDTMPNCFHESSTGNLHFHGTHTSPTSTGDNVFLGVRPSPRDANGPTVTEATFKAAYDTFFAACEKSLRANNKNQWPVTWPPALNADTTHEYKNDPPANWEQDPLGWTYKQARLLYDHDPALLKADVTLSTEKQWPQYYLGSAPTCFVLPDIADKSQHLEMGQAPGTHWYHAHKHGSTSANVANGMAGAFIIEGDDYDGAFDKFYGPGWTRKQPVMVVNQVANSLELEIPLNVRPAAGSAPFSVNGQQQPTLLMRPGEVQLWRVVNASPVDGFYLAGLPEGFDWQQTAQDGVQFDAYNFTTRARRPVYVAAANRIDLLVKAPTAPKPEPYAVQVWKGPSIAKAIGSTTPPPTPSRRPKPTNLLNVFVTGAAVIPPMEIIPAANLGQRPAFLNDLAWPDSDPPTRTFTFSTTGASGQRQHTINGMKFDPEHPVKIDRVNTVEEWKVVNTTTVGGGIDHPFHIHINPFQVTSVFSPNAPMVYTNGQPVRDKTSNQPVPLYVIAPAVPVYAAYQCVLRPDDDKSWVPCAKTPPNCGDAAPSGPPWAPCNASPPVQSNLSKTNIWWDVFPIPAGVAVKDGTTEKVISGYFTMVTKFADYQGAFVMHCHILAHEDRGMMMSVQVGTSNPAELFAHH
jgi:FtsP/CotA-like multicopper oxidase with cupredoxin domain